MFYPKLFNDDFFDDFFEFPRMRMPEDAERKLYGKHVNGIMKTDVRDKDGNYELDIDLPGFKKDEISLTLDNGYLVVGACKALDEADVKAKFEDGVLSLTFPKEKEPELPEKKTIMIEG